MLVKNKKQKANIGNKVEDLKMGLGCWVHELCHQDFDLRGFVVGRTLTWAESCQTTHPSSNMSDLSRKSLMIYTYKLQHMAYQTKDTKSRTKKLSTNIDVNTNKRFMTFIVLTFNISVC